MTTYNLSITTRERDILKEAITMTNDMRTDLFLENTTVNLFPDTDDTVTLTNASAKALREELMEDMENMVSLRSLMTKLGCPILDTGYSA